MFDGVTMNGTLPQAIASLDTLDIPVYQIAAPAQMWNTFGTTTDQLLQLRPDQFDGVVLVNGSHVDSMLGSNPLVDFFAQLVTQRSPKGNTSAVDTLSTGWINDLYVGAGPDAPQFGLYGTAGQPIILGNASGVVLPTPLASQLGPVETLVKKWTAVFMPLIFGGPPSSARDTGRRKPAGSKPRGDVPDSQRVTGVKTGNTTLTIQVGSRTYNAPPTGISRLGPTAPCRPTGSSICSTDSWPANPSTRCWPDRWPSRPIASSSRRRCRRSRR